LTAYFASNPAMSESAIAMLSKANRRALSASARPLAAAAARATALSGGTSEPAQWIAIAVCSLVRSVLARPPTRFTSLKSRAKAALPGWGGPCQANCLAPLMAKGRTPLQCGSTGFAFMGGVAW
jgi:hypothetical protein